VSGLSVREAVLSGEPLAFDTCVLIEIWRADRAGRAPPIDLTKVPQGQRGVPTVALWEFLRTLAGPHEQQAERRRWVSKTFAIQLLLEPGVDAALRALLRSFPATELPDALIAATCIARRAALLTLNRRHFDGLPRLRLVDL
jgi:predicted nucleic acid-binding protein